MENSNNEQMNNSSFKLPKNIRQIGYVGDTKRTIYVEDYVMTFVKQLAQKEQTNLKVAVLLGHYVRTEDGKNLFIKGAIEMVGEDLEKRTIFSDEGWTSIYENIKKYFSNDEIVGWTLIGPEFLIDSSEKIRKLHIDNFQGPDKILLKIDSLEKEEAFYIFENNQLVKQKGYYIYYEKNEEMQNYMVENKEVVSEEADFVDHTTQKIRAVIQEKKETKEDKSVSKLMYAATTLMAIIVLVIAATMLKNYEQMHDMEAAIKTLSANLSNDGQKETGSAVNSADNKDASVENKENDKNESKSSNNETESNSGDKKGVVEVETVPGNVTPTEEANAKEESTEKSKSSNDVTVKETDNTDKKATTEATKKATEEKVTEAKTSDKKEVAASAEVKYYTVKSGDSLAGICYKLYGSVDYLEKIMKLNSIEDENKIYIGQKLIIP